METPATYQVQAPQSFRLKIEGKAVPASRPRVTRRGTYYGSKYKNWRLQAERILRAQWNRPPLERAAVSITLIGKHDRGCDADNVGKAVLDSLVAARILVKDNFNGVSTLAVTLAWSTESPVMLVELTPVG